LLAISSPGSNARPQQAQELEAGVTIHCSGKPDSVRALRARRVGAPFFQAF
jgi:hypothetical protein